MLKRLSGVAAPLCALLFLACQATAQAQLPPMPPPPVRVPALYTTWDDYYFYAGFQVDDRNVISTNITPNSQPQQDDDIEVFFETDDAHASVRTPQTYQMAVSAGNGAYFSVGDGTSIPKAEVVYTYKYAATVDGTLNDPGDTDVGYTVELAIPWAELGRTGPPANGTTWGFNVISRNRSSMNDPATSFYSLSPQVQSSADVQDPAKWTQITFTTSGQATSESVDHVFCPHTTLGNFPSIDGEIRSGKWPASSKLSFGGTPVDSPAPTVAQEPNTTQSPFSAPPPTTAPTPVKPLPVAPVGPPVPVVTAPATPAAPTSIDLPGGGSIRMVPGGIKNPAGLSPSAPAQIATAQGPFVNPLSPKVPLKYQKAYQGGDANDVAPQLAADKPTRLIMAIYRLDYNADGRKATQQNVWNTAGGSRLLDQPMNGAGPWFSALRPEWHEQQLADMRRGGIEVAVLKLDPNDPLLGRELNALAEALKEMKFAGKDYPLITGAPDGPLAADGQPLWTRFIPEEFRANVTSTQVSSATVVSPGGQSGDTITARDEGKTYAAAWQKALAGSPSDILIDSWNDFTHGTEITASRQYAERYVDDSRIDSIAFHGRREWHAKYLKWSVPTTIQTKTLYQIPVRIENAGTLPWRAGEQYSLCARWYTPDGRIADDSAPRIPVGKDVLPGQTVNLSLGLTARNGYGGDLDPGDYIVVIDMVQGQSRWFTFAGDAPLEVPVHVVAAGSASALPQATFIGTTTPASGSAGETLRGEIAVRNDGPQPWVIGDNGKGDTLTCKIDSVGPDGTETAVGQMKGQPLSPVSVLPGELVRPFPNLTLVDSQNQPLPPGDYDLHWFVQDEHGHAIPGRYDEQMEVTPTDPGASFVLSDIPRQMNTGQDVTVSLAVQNLSGTAWAKNGPKIGYHWYYLDGTEAQWDGGILTPLSEDVPANKIDGDMTVKVRAPDQPGRYSLVMDMQETDGSWASVSAAAKGNDLLQAIIDVTGKGSAIPVDLSKDFNVSTADFAGTGTGFPVEMLPPDGTAEILTNPLELANQLGSKTPAPLYPDGYYTSHANHAVNFLYASSDGSNNAVACQGQTLALPGGNYRTIHILAAVGGADPVTASFGLGGSTQSVTVAPWTAVPNGTEAGYTSPDYAGPNGFVAIPVTLGDYVLKVTPGQRVDSLTLPNAPSVKIVAVTLEK